MMRLVMLLAMALALAWSPASLAHGPKGHDEEKAAEVTSQPDIETGATSEASEAAAPQAGDVAEQEPRVTVASVLENLHPATVHFPIGLLFAAALVEILAWRRRSQRLADAATVMVGAGAIGAVIAALFGWIHTGVWFGGDGLVQWHRWLGTNLAALALLTWWAGRNPAYRKTFRVLLFSAAALILFQGYLGGELAHGPNHLADEHHEAGPDEEVALAATPQGEDDPASGESGPAIDRGSAESRADAAVSTPARASRQVSGDASGANPAPSPSSTSAPAPEPADPHAGHDMDATPTD